ncbi:5-aminolevulinate synthase [Fluviispira multicolorata]|uniref:5-aminolevulinate synthase n=1 Tax=Fluviispira multicolorata TaxID=2654512 RepID=A0A833JB37_9BACT|nr:5-aminolevulinate synthase [Fluviispira multicolorata]KAB8028605.1 5-aminolevulinate synthase [Fluviispira multicolorata]
MYNQTFNEKIKQLKENGGYREFITIDRICKNYPHAQAKIIENNIETTYPVVVWCSNDYLGMSQNEFINDAMIQAIKSHGAGSGGSRNIGGSHSFYSKLEATLAEWHNKEAALVYPTGYGSNDATLQCLLRLDSDFLILSDEKNHASIINGICSTKNERRVFKHNNVDHLKSLLDEIPKERKKIIVFESIYSMDGDIAPIEKIVALAKQYNALTFLDEVHAIGMYGPRGAGIAAEIGISDDIDIFQGTMAKAIGVIGGYIAASALLIDIVRSFATGFIFTTSLPPAVVAACLASIEHLKTSDTERNKLHAKTLILKEALLNSHLPIMSSTQTHIIPVLVGDSLKCKEASKRLLKKHGVYLQAINSPTVKVGTERFRINITPNHTEKDIIHLTEALVETFKYFKIPFSNEKFKNLA